MQCERVVFLVAKNDLPIICVQEPNEAHISSNYPPKLLNKVSHIAYAEHNQVLHTCDLGVVSYHKYQRQIVNPYYVGLPDSQ